MKNDKKPKSTRSRAARRGTPQPIVVAAAPPVGPQRMVARHIFGQLDEGHRRRLVVFVGPANSCLAPAAALWFGALAAEGKATVVLAYPDGAPVMLSPELILALAEDGLEPRRLQVRALTPELVAAADLVVTMSSGGRSRMKLPPTTRRREHWTISHAAARPPATPRTKAKSGAARKATTRVRAAKGDALAEARALRDLLRARVAMLVFSEGWGRPEISREDARVTRTRSGNAEDSRDEFLPLEPFVSRAGSFGPGVVPEITPAWFPQPSLSPPSLR